MKLSFLVAALVATGSVWVAGIQAGEAAGSGQPTGKPSVQPASQPGTQPASPLVPVSVFTEKDIPEAEPGKPAWPTGPECTYGLAYYDKWVYAAGKGEYILQFERDPATAKLTYRGATPFVGFHTEEKNTQVVCRVRRTADGQALLTIRHGDHKVGYMWYAIDQDTGKLTPAGQQVPPLFERHHAVQLWTPDQQRFCVGGAGHNKIEWFRFGPDGAPVADGSFALKNVSVGNAGAVMFSPDWRHMYCLVLQCPDQDPKNDKTPQIDTYAMDLKTNTGTYVSSLELPIVGTPQVRVSGALEPFSPDGKRLYAFFAGGPNCYYYVLTRDPDSGALRIAGAKAEPTLRGVIGAPWSRPDRLAFNADGRSGFFIYSSDKGPVGSFTCDPATGLLTLCPPVDDLGARKLVVDPVHGNLFTVGEKIASFKILAAQPSANAK